jgi:hypothetical protein
VQIRVIRATLSFVVFLLAILILAGNAALAQESLRISRPKLTEPAAATVEMTTKTQVEKPADKPVAKSAERPSEKPVSGGVSSTCCGSTACGVDCSDLPPTKSLSSSLPPDGLYARWRAEFVNPTMCPILLCHGSCAGSTMSCKNIKTMIDSLLDAYIPEDPPLEAVLNFRCCAGFTED